MALWPGHASNPARQGAGGGLVRRGLDALAGRHFRWSRCCFLSFGNCACQDPIVNLRILKNRNFAVACALFFLFGAAIYGLITLQPLFLQTLLGYTALEAGLTVTPRGMGAFVALFVVGALIAKVGGRRLAAFGFVVFSFGAFCSAGFPWIWPGAASSRPISSAVLAPASFLCR